MGTKTPNRSLSERFTLGLVQLNPNGSTVVDKNGVPVPTYNESTVTNLAKAVTGWTYPTAPGATPKNNNGAYYDGEMFVIEAATEQHCLIQRNLGAVLRDQLRNAPCKAIGSPLRVRIHPVEKGDFSDG